MKCDKPQRGSSLKSTSKATKAFRPGRYIDNNFTFVVASVGHTVGPNQATPVEEEKGSPSADNAKPAVSLVAHYNG